MIRAASPDAMLSGGRLWRWSHNAIRLRATVRYWLRGLLALRNGLLGYTRRLAMRLSAVAHPCIVTS
jgi:hypothetical protein